MPRIALTAAFCAAATCPTGRKRIDYYDTSGTIGFVLEVRSSGAKTYVLRYTDDGGRLRQLRIGGFSEITFDQARKKARQLKAEIVLGEDPAGRKKAKKAIPLYKDLADQHLAHAKSYLRRPENVESVLTNHLIPKWGKLRLDEIKTQDIAKWLAEKAKAGMAPATIAKLRATLGRSFELGGQWQIPGAVPNPVKNVPLRKFDNARTRFLSPEEAARLHKAASESDNPQLASIVALLLLTGARKTELLRAKWEHVDLERRLWLIPETKNGTSRHVPLSAQAVEVIGKLPRWKDCEWLIPNPKTRNPYNQIKRAWNTARNAAGCSGLRLHDLRHSFCSSAVAAGVDLYTVGKIAGHKDYKSSQRYSHLADETLMKAVEKSAANLKVDWAAGASA